MAEGQGSGWCVRSLPYISREGEEGKKRRTKARNKEKAKENKKVKREEIAMSTKMECFVVSVICSWCSGEVICWAMIS